MSRLIIILSLCVVVFIYLGLRLTGIGSASWLIAVLSVVFLFLYPLVWRGMFSESTGSKIRNLAHFDMGFVSFLMALLFIRDLLVWPVSWWAPEVGVYGYSGEATAVVICIALLMLAYGSWNALRGARVVTIDIPVANLPAELSDFTIAQISDLHVGPGIDARYVEKVVHKVLSLKASAVVMTGDIADGAFEKYREATRSLAELAQDSPLIYVVGNHEYYWGGEVWLQHFRDLGARVLENENWSMPFRGRSVLFAGVLDPAVKMLRPADGPNVERSLKNAAPADLKVLLSHHPGVAREAAKLKFDLQLSGHTHSGQFFPWNLVIGFVHEFSRGLARCGSMWVYVNPGTGWWGPPLRLGTTPEITFLRLRSA